MAPFFHTGGNIDILPSLNKKGMHSPAEEEAVWDTISSLFKSQSVVAHQLQSYNHFVETQLPFIFSENSDLAYLHSNKHISHHISFVNVTVNPPSVQEADGFFVPTSPYICRLRGITYSSCVTADVVHDRVDQTGEQKKVLSRRVFRNVVLAQIPVMLRSKLCVLNPTNDSDLSKDARSHECHVDTGGYFIIAGNEKVLVPQQKIKTNNIFVFPARACDSKFAFLAELRSCHEAKLRSTSTLYILLNDIESGAIPVISCRLPFLKTALSPFAVFAMLGVETVNGMVELFGEADEDTLAILRLVLDADPHNGSPPESTIEAIGKQVTTETTRSSKEARERYIQHIVTSELVPHMGVRYDAETNKKKALFLAAMLTRLVRVGLGKDATDDRDDFANKRVDSAGGLMALLIRQHHRGNMLRKLSTQLRKKVESPKESTFSVGEIVSHRLITSGLRYAFATGTWGIQRGAGASGGGQTGVVQILPRLTTMASLSALRKINVPVAREGRAAGPRMLHSSAWGFICPSDTPEGISCGLVSTLSMGVHVRLGAPTQPIALVVLALDGVVGISDATPEQRRKGSVIVVNGVFVAYTTAETTPFAVATELRRQRRIEKNLPFDCSVSVDAGGQVSVCADHGALLRPLVVADRYGDFVAQPQSARGEGEASACLFRNLIARGIVEFVDSGEQQNCRVATYPSELRRQERMAKKAGIDPATDPDRYTHVEIHPSLINGIAVSQIPFSEHNQAPRVAYQAAQCKQAIGLYTTNFFERLDTVAHVLSSPQKALVTTRLEDLLGTSVVRSGAVPVVAIMCYTGFNQDDSIIVNQSAVDRGLFHTFCYHTLKDEEKTSGADAEKFENPSLLEKCGGLKQANYAKIDAKGLPILGQVYHDGDIIIGKTVAMSQLQVDPREGEARREVKRCRSTVLKSDESVVVDGVCLSKTVEGKATVKVRTRALRVPIVGDKYSSRHGQKGVCGIMLPAADFPSTRDGLQPDLIINPNAIPSRMTIGMLIEMCLSKLAAAQGESKDGTPFSGASLQNISEELIRHGFHPFGNEKLINGMTGAELDSEIFIAPCYYQRLKHMVVDKAHARNRGATQLLTRAPTEGRSRDGGLRCGEMEKDAISSWGAAHVLQDRLHDQSDAFACVACSSCGDFASSASCADAEKEDNGYFCHRCGTGKNCLPIKIPFAFKLLMQEINGCGIETKFHFD